MDIIDFRKSYPALLVPLQSWNAFEDFSDQQPFQSVLRSSNQDALHHSSTSDQFLNLNVLEVAIYLFILVLMWLL